ncbi:hypothetical protein WJM97_17325 [Okeanomitos corallinicola TIOX110]|uniref:Glucose-inhibited division protein A n=1 Tax=Okeanomitos corallinicola TIOX110 TaxID=3133117 RepID=A0ABZ2UQ39_9CYAN
MNRSKIVAIITGVISILLAIAYLIVVQILDYRDMKPAPISYINSSLVMIFPGNLHNLRVDKISTV